MKIIAVNEWQIIFVSAKVRTFFNKGQSNFIYKNEACANIEINRVGDKSPPSTLLNGDTDLSS